MIYFDNSATTLQKPPSVGQAVADAISTFGNPGRSFAAPSMEAARAVYQARCQIAKLVKLDNPLQIAFTSGATESLNLAISSLISPTDGVITTLLEHNSVLRPLYRMGCPLAFLDCDDNGSLCLETLPRLIRRETRFVVATHGSNLVGSLTDTHRLYQLCQQHGLTLILDVSQTLGCLPVTADLADLLCFTGHKGLLGPQGTGGIIASSPLPFRLTKTGGSGWDSFAPHQPMTMPDIFEAGTQNAHSLAGLAAGVSHLHQVGLEQVYHHHQQLTARFLQGIQKIPGMILYGPRDGANRLPVVALNLDGMPSEDLALRLWEDWGIATRAGSHCAPLAHKRFGTQQTGMVRFSFGLYNTLEEIDQAIEALTQIGREAAS